MYNSQPLCCTLETLDQLFFNKINTSWNSTNLGSFLPPKYRILQPARRGELINYSQHVVRGRRGAEGKPDTLTTPVKKLQTALSSWSSPNASSPSTTSPLLLMAPGLAFCLFKGPASLCGNSCSLCPGSPLPSLHSPRPRLSVILWLSPEAALRTPSNPSFIHASEFYALTTNVPLLQGGQSWHLQHRRD